MYTDTNISDVRRDSLIPPSAENRDHRENTEQSHTDTVQQDRVTELDIINAVERINNAMNLFDKRLRVMLRKGQNGGTMAHVMDRETSALIRIISVEEIVKLDQELSNKLGVFMDEVA